MSENTRWYIFAGGAMAGAAVGCGVLLTSGFFMRQAERRIFETLKVADNTTKTKSHSPKSPKRKTSGPSYDIPPPSPFQAGVDVHNFFDTAGIGHQEVTDEPAPEDAGVSKGRRKDWIQERYAQDSNLPSRMKARVVTTDETAPISTTAQLQSEYENDNDEVGQDKASFPFRSFTAGWLHFACDPEVQSEDK
ncbi:hypothetical protein CYMTET_47022 [Cymbomonas tetramitiformis]|uniref:Transmembrane protein n=1 Tax=Cymbomonas tetramitiformis TaxID=36881 RepID=A0AAE0BWE7_9CHLO|nr:hypothetical protein CYMTET_47022 [Cymbomonas tetramitiformis]